MISDPEFTRFIAEDSVPLETRRSSFKTALSSLSRRKSNINELMTRISLSSSASVKDRWFAALLFLA